MSNKSSKYKRVVITGLGTISSLGTDIDEFWRNLISGKSGISKIESIEIPEFNRHYAGEVKSFDTSKFFGNRTMNHIGRTSQMALAATKLAIEDAGLDLDYVKKRKVGICIGTTMGEPQVLEVMNNVLTTRGINDIDVKLAPVYPSNIICSSIGRNLGVTGENLLLANACSAGNYSMGHAFDNINLGKVDMMIAGGADSFSKLNIVGFNRLFAVAPEKCQPFDKNRKGMMVGEGAGIVIIETLESAKKRDAYIYAEILGYGLSCDAHHMTVPAADGIEKAVFKALNFTGIAIDEVDYICAHGTGTEQNDKNEAKAIRDIFYTNGHETPVSSIKSMLGHTMGAASAIEGISCCLAIKNGIIPPTINFQEADPECNIDCVPNKSRLKDLNIVLNNSFAFGGNNACLVLKRN